MIECILPLANWYFSMLWWCKWVWAQSIIFNTFYRLIRCRERSAIRTCYRGQCCWHIATWIIGSLYAYSLASQYGSSQDCSITSRGNSYKPASARSLSAEPSRIQNIPTTIFPMPFSEETADTCERREKMYTKSNSTITHPEVDKLQYRVYEHLRIRTWNKNHRALMRIRSRPWVFCIYNHWRNCGWGS